MVIDARITNFRHRVPPTTRLGSGSNFAHLDVSDESLQHFLGATEGEQLGFGNELDVSDCFYQFRIPNMAQWFGIDFPKPAEFWSQYGVDLKNVYEDDLECDIALQPGETVYPVIGAMAMGWSWALFLAHESVSYLARMASPSPGLELRDKRPVPQLWHGDALISTYVDNVSVVGATSEAVLERCQCLSKKFRDLEIPIEWTYDEPQRSFETVGVVVDFSDKLVRNKGTRLWRVYMSAIAICRRSKIRPEVVEVWVGHATSVFRLTPYFLSVFSQVYRFVQSSRGRRVQLWPSVRSET